MVLKVRPDEVSSGSRKLADWRKNLQTSGEGQLPLVLQRELWTKAMKPIGLKNSDRACWSNFIRPTAFPHGFRLLFLEVAGHVDDTHVRQWSCPEPPASRKVSASRTKSFTRAILE